MAVKTLSSEREPDNYDFDKYRRKIQVLNKNKPDGATHYCQLTNYYYKVEGGVCMYYRYGLHKHYWTVDPLMTTTQIDFKLKLVGDSK